MAKLNLEGMSREELFELRRKIDKAIKSFEARMRKEALAAAEAAAKEKGFSLSALTGGSAKISRSSIPPKYRHPENPSLTWSGRGRQPDWYKELLKAGTPKDELLISN